MSFNVYKIIYKFSKLLRRSRLKKLSILNYLQLRRPYCSSECNVSSDINWRSPYEDFSKIIRNLTSGLAEVIVWRKQWPHIIQSYSSKHVYSTGTVWGSLEQCQPRTFLYIHMKIRHAVKEEQLFQEMVDPLLPRGAGCHSVM